MNKGISSEIVNSKISLGASRCLVKDLGLIEYRKAYQIQQQCVQEALEKKENVLIFCEHFPVITLGRMSHQENFLVSPEFLKQKGVETINIDRGGDLTLHAPGQLIIYPILNLNYFGRDLKVYLEKLEQVAIDLLNDFDILALGIPQKRGVWVGLEKIASIGIGVRKWVSFHGLSVNINNDLSLFSMIRPCGLDVQMTSIQKIKKTKISLDEVKKRFLFHFSNKFNLEIIAEQL